MAEILTTWEKRWREPGVITHVDYVVDYFPYKLVSVELDKLRDVLRDVLYPSFLIH